MSARFAGLCLAAILVSCAHGGARSDGRNHPSQLGKSTSDPDWELVVPDGGWVFDEPAAGRVHVVERGRVVSFPPGAPAPAGLARLAAGRLPYVHERSEVTAAGALRWREHDGWHGERGLLPLPDAPLVRVVAGVLLHVPTDGPGAGLPRVLCLFGKDASLPAPDAVLVLRAETVLAVSSAGAHHIDAGACEATRLALPEGELLRTEPGLDPTGRWGALAVRARDGVRIVLLDGAKALRSVPVPDEPRVLHLDAGALFAQGVRPDGALLRLPVDGAGEGALSSRDEAVRDHRRGLFVRLLERVEAADAAGAVDTWDALALDGLLERTDADDEALLRRAAELARPLLEQAGRQARSEGRRELAAALSRRAALLDGRPLEETPAPPPLRLAVRVDEELADHVAIEAARARVAEALPPGAEVIVGCPQAPGQDACLELALGSDALTDTEPLLAANGAAIRREAERAFDARAECLDEGQAVLDETPAGPRSAFLCDLKTGTGARAAALARLLVEREGLSGVSLARATVRLADGTTRGVALPGVTFPQSLTQALDAALALQGQADLLAARRAGGAPAESERALRAILWRGSAGDEELRAAVRGDGRLRPSWFGGRP